MKLNLFAIAALLLSTPVFAGPGSSCSTEHIATRRDTCGSIAREYGITVRDLQNWNYDLGDSPRFCQQPIPGRAYCVKPGRIADRGRERGGFNEFPRRELNLVKRASKEKAKEKAKEHEKEAKEDKKEKTKEKNKEMKAEEKADEKKHDKEVKAEDKAETKAHDKEVKKEDKAETKAHDKEMKKEEKKEEKAEEKKDKADEKKEEKKEEKEEEKKESKQKKKGKESHKNNVKESPKEVKESSNDIKELTSTDNYQEDSEDSIDDFSSEDEPKKDTLELAPHTHADCKKYYVVQNHDSCDSVSKKNHISNQQLYDYNTGLHRRGAHECDNLDVGKAYCVSIKD